jgi:HlyD family secretion protein
VRFTVDAFPERSFEGRVQQIRLNPTTQQNVVTYNVRVSLSNPEHILLPGMTAYVSIAVAQRDDVSWCPTRRCASSPGGRQQVAPRGIGGVCGVRGAPRRGQQGHRQGPHARSQGRRAAAAPFTSSIEAS